ncbi:YndM family protein [Lentibacillus juripiscarius]|uniref:YndM family protein n=1 Tax=Lentibacillus juripiscarius TaxID=257446 RepID=A0ABW5V5K7_9BACI
MVHLKTLGIKAIAIGITVFSLFGIFYNANMMNLFWISVLVTGVSYLIGDLFVLRRFGNVVASVADFPLAFLSLWVLGSMFIDIGIPIVTTSLIAAFFITCCEPFIHTYITEQMEEKSWDEGERSPVTGQLQTEFAEEFESDILTDNKESHRDK